MFPGGFGSTPGTNIVKASCLPSGDQVIPPQVSARFVRRISLPESIRRMMSSVCPPLCEAKKMRLPSGDQRGELA